MFSNHGKKSVADIPCSDQRWIKLSEFQDYKPTISFQVAVKFILGQKKEIWLLPNQPYFFSGDPKKFFENIKKKKKPIKYIYFL